MKLADDGTGKDPSTVSFCTPNPTDEHLLDLIERLTEGAEAAMWERSNRYEDDRGHECVSCGKENEEHVAREERSHYDHCILVSDLRAARAFIRIERSLAEEKRRRQAAKGSP